MYNSLEGKHYVVTCVRNSSYLLMVRKMNNKASRETSRKYISRENDLFLWTRPISFISEFCFAPWSTSASPLFLFIKAYVGSIMYYSQQTTKQTKEPACGTWMMCMDSRNSKIIERWGCIWCLGSRLVQRYNSLLDHIYIRPHFVVRKMRLEGKGLKPESHSWLVVKMDHFSKRCFVGGDSKPRVLVFVLSFFSSSTA